MASRSRHLSCLLLAILIVATSTPITKAAPEVDSRYGIDPTTARVGFDLEATLHTVHGRTEQVSGEIVAKASSTPEAFDLTGSVRISAAGLDTGNGHRDKKMREESFAVGRYPAITFDAEHLGPGRVHPDNEKRTSHTLRGNLTIRGVVRSVEIPVVVEESIGRLIVEGNLTIRWADFGIPDPSFLFVRIQPAALVAFHIELVPEI